MSRAPHRAIACALLVAAAAALSPAQPALAQKEVGGGGDPGEGGRSGVVAPPAERYAVSPGGVDMRTGVYAYRQTDLSIGEDSEAGGLALTRSNPQALPGHIDPFANFSHNWDIMISEKRISLFNSEFNNGSGQDYRMTVHFGGRSETFDATFSQPAFEQVSRSSIARLTYSGDPSTASVVYSFRAADGTLAVFRALGTGAAADCSSLRRCAYVSHVVLSDGTRFDFTYATGSGQNATRLRRVTSSRGFALLLQYGSGADAGHVVAACTLNLAVQTAPTDHSCPVGAQGNASYAYTDFAGERRLASATDAGGGAWTFGYSGTATNYTVAFTRPGEASPWLVNSVGETPDNDGGHVAVVHSQAFADGSSFGYGWDTSPQFVEGEFPQVAGGSWIDAAGATTQVRYGFPRVPETMPPGIYQPPVEVDDIMYQITPGPERMVDPLGRETLTDYCDPNAMAGLPPYINHRCLVAPVAMNSTDPEGIKTFYTWDIPTRNLLQARQVAKPGSGLADIIRSWTWDCTNLFACNKPTSATDANGNVTNYEYSTTHGGVLRETLPAPSAGAPRPETRYEYVQRTARISNGAGGTVDAGPPVWLLAATSTCRTSAATGNPASPCTAANDEIRTAYDYGPTTGPNNLLLRGMTVTGAGGLVQRTCYGYDARGRRISETGPGAGLGACP